jgi:hypothetical protein
MRIRSNGIRAIALEDKDEVMVSVSPMASRKLSFLPPMDNPSVLKKSKSGQRAGERMAWWGCGSTMAMRW